MNKEHKKTKWERMTQEQKDELNRDRRYNYVKGSRKEYHKEYDKKRWANMSKEQRKTLNEKRRAKYIKGLRKEYHKEYDKKRREKKKYHALNESRKTYNGNTKGVLTIYGI